VQCKTREQMKRDWYVPASTQRSDPRDVLLTRLCFFLTFGTSARRHDPTLAGTDPATFEPSGSRTVPTTQSQRQIFNCVLYYYQLSIEQNT